MPVFPIDVYKPPKSYNCTNGLRFHTTGEKNATIYFLFPIFHPLRVSVGLSEKQVQERTPICQDNLIHRHLRVASQAISVRMRCAFK